MQDQDRKEREVISTLLDSCKVWCGRSMTPPPPAPLSPHPHHLVSSLYYLLSIPPFSSPQTPSLDSFVAAFNTLPLSPGLCYGEVVRRVLAEESFWAREPLTRLLEAHLCPPRYIHTPLPTKVHTRTSLPTCIHASLFFPNYSLYGDVLDTAAERNDWVRGGEGRVDTVAMVMRGRVDCCYGNGREGGHCCYGNEREDRLLLW